jgi:hypothetical protein
MDLEAACYACAARADGVLTADGSYDW